MSHDILLNSVFIPMPCLPHKGDTGSNIKICSAIVHNAHNYSLVIFSAPFH